MVSAVPVGKRKLFKNNLKHYFFEENKDWKIPEKCVCLHTKINY